VDDKPIREIKPVVIPAQFLVGGALASASLALIPGLVVGFIVLSATKIPHPDDAYMPGTYQWGLAVGAGLAAFGFTFAVSMVLMGISAFKGPGCTTYTIFPDRIECCEGVWVRTRRHVALDRVQGVEAAEGILQQTRGAGTIIVFAREEGSSEDQEVPTSGNVKRIELVNVAHPNEVYELIRTLVMQKNGPTKALQRTGHATNGPSSHRVSPA
jgi:membrane protein YdbS with pleckstrin-like domain